MTTLNILIVDNDAGSRRLIRLALLAQSYECMAYEADSAKAAIGTLAQHGEHCGGGWHDGAACERY